MSIEDFSKVSFTLVRQQRRQKGPPHRAEVRRTPAAPARPHPARAVDPGLPVRPGAARRAGDRPPGGAVDPGAGRAGAGGRTAWTAPCTSSTSATWARSVQGRLRHLHHRRSAAGDARRSRRRFPGTVELAATAMIFAVAVGIPLGFVAARRYGSWVDNLSTVGLAARASPSRCSPWATCSSTSSRSSSGWFPDPGPREHADVPQRAPDRLLRPGRDRHRQPRARRATRCKHLILPAIALGTIPLAFITRITRAAVLEVSNEDYVRTAEAKGMTRVGRRAAGTSCATRCCRSSPSSACRPGCCCPAPCSPRRSSPSTASGRFLAQAVFNRDFPVIQGGILFLAVVFVLVNLLVDLSYGVLDPRVRTR